MEDRLNISIGFLQAMLLQSKSQDNRRIEFDDETIEILLNLLKDCKTQIVTYNKELFDLVREANKDYLIEQMSQACKYCSNNPQNGGSGVCHCTLGTTVAVLT